MRFDDLSQPYKELNKQHNIMVLVGNGFDINLLKYCRKDYDEVVTTYTKFYEYLKFKGWIHEDNVLVNAMKEAQKKGRKDWSDFEDRIPEVLDSNNPDKVNKDLNDLQKYFSIFLDRVVTPEIENEVSDKSVKYKWARRSLANFSKDLKNYGYENLKFLQNISHNDGIDYLFINFNYTNLLDNYIYLDKEQFDPHPYKNVDRNFGFYTPEIRYSTYVHTMTVHPHGRQSIPRSLLFGTNEEKYKSERNLEKFNKEYWAQYSKFYSNLFDDTELFIIYGSSIGKSDDWWWKSICNAISSDDKEYPELIIYWYDPDGSNGFDVDRFINSRGIDVSSEEAENIRQHTFVINYKDADKLEFLTLKEKKFSDDFEENQRKIISNPYEDYRV